VSKTTIRLPIPIRLSDVVKKPFKLEFSGGVIEGVYSITEVAPMTPITLDSDRAHALLVRFGEHGDAEIDGEADLALDAEID